MPYSGAWRESDCKGVDEAVASGVSQTYGDCDRENASKLALYILLLIGYRKKHRSFSPLMPSTS
jgi:hypothetical protein